MDERQFLEKQCIMFAAAALVNMMRSKTDARPIGSKMPEKPEEPKEPKPTAQRRVLASARVSGKKRGREEDTPSSKKRAKPEPSTPTKLPVLTLDMAACAAVSNEDEIPEDYVFTPDIDVGRVGVKKSGASAWGAAADGGGFSLTAEEQIAYFE